MSLYLQDLKHISYIMLNNHFTIVINNRKMYKMYKQKYVYINKCIHIQKNV